MERMYYKQEYQKLTGTKINNAWRLCINSDDVSLYRVFKNAWGNWTVQKTDFEELFWMFDTKNEAMEEAEFKSGIYSGRFGEVKRPRARNK